MSARATLLALVIALGADLGLAQSTAHDQAAHVAALCADGRLAEALEAARMDPVPSRAAKLEADVWWTAGDLGRALGAARAGLEDAPDDLALCSLATDLALALDLSVEAEHHVEGLGRALEAQPADAPNLEWWHTRCAHLRAACEAAGLERDARAQARSRARVVALIGALGALVALLWLLRPGAAAPAWLSAPR